MHTFICTHVHMHACTHAHVIVQRYLIFCCFILGTDPVFVTKTIVPDLPSNHNILALSQVMKRYFSEYKTTLSHSLLKVAYRGPTFFATENVTDDFMRCNKPPEPKPYGYMCIDHKRWIIKTTTDYDPSTIARELVTLTLEVNGENSSGGNLSDVYNVKINIQPRCTVQARSYEAMKPICTPRVNELTNPLVNENIFLYNLPLDDLQKTIEVYDIKFNTILSFRFKVFCDELFIYEADVDITGTKQNLPIRKICQKGAKSLKLKFEALTGVFLLPTNINLTYHAMEDFCRNTDCIKKFRLWSWLASGIHSDRRSCIKDTLGLVASFKVCHGMHYHTLKVSVCDP